MIVGSLLSFLAVITYLPIWLDILFFAFAIAPAGIQMFWLHTRNLPLSSRAGIALGAYGLVMDALRPAIISTIRETNSYLNATTATVMAGIGIALPPLLGAMIAFSRFMAHHAQESGKGAMPEKYQHVRKKSHTASLVMKAQQAETPAELRAVALQNGEGMPEQGVLLGSEIRVSGDYYDENDPGHPFILPEESRFLHTIVIGPTGSGKTSRILMPMIGQDLTRICMGEQLCVAVVEPKGDLVAQVYDICQQLDIPCVIIDPERSDESGRFNPLEGPIEDVVPIMQSVMEDLTSRGSETSFFSDVGVNLLTNVVILEKTIHGDNLTLADIKHALQNMDTTLRNELRQYERLVSQQDETLMYFQRELFGLDQKHESDIRAYSMDLRNQLDKLTDTPAISRLLNGRSSINLDRWFLEGGVLLVNTSAGRLGNLGDLLGKFLIMHIQRAMFRRPRAPRGEARVPAYLYVDEFPRYEDKSVLELLTQARSFRFACTFAIQATSQLVIHKDASMRDTILTNCRNKIVFTPSDIEEATRLSKQFGRVEREQVSKTYEHVGPFRGIFPHNTRIDRKDQEIFDPTRLLLGLPPYHFLLQYLDIDGHQKNVGPLRPPLWWQVEMPPLTHQQRQRIRQQRKLRSILRWAIPQKPESSKAVASEGGGDAPEKRGAKANVGQEKLVRMDLNSKIGSQQFEQPARRDLVSFKKANRPKEEINGVFSDAPDLPKEFVKPQR